jgi:tetratricopeptide (TPR) repeat protein
MIDRGHAPEALKQLDMMAAQPPVPAGVDRLRGLALYSLNRFAEADAAFASALKDDPHDQEAKQMRGLTLFRLGRPADAIPLLEAAHDWGPETKADPSYVLALCYLDTRRYDDARRAFATQYGFAADSAPAYLLTARMLLRREYVPVAQEFARKALELDPQLPLAHALLGEIALAGEHLSEAVAEFEKERIRNPLDGSIYDRLGDAYTRSGEYTKAQQSLQRAVLLEPYASGPYILLGKVLLKQQDPVSALMYLERAEKMDPSNYMTHSLLGQAYRSVGRAEDASRETQIAQKLQSASEPKLEGLH